MKNVLIINAHPVKKSFCSSLAFAYFKGADSYTENRTLVNLSDLEFDPILRNGYKTKQHLEPDLVIMQRLIKNANHIVFVFPVWWGTYPALLKGFIDRVFIPDFAFKYKEKSPLPEKLLSGKSARLIITSDTPNWYSRFVYKRPAINSLKKCVFQFCGINPIKTTIISPIKKLNLQKRKFYLKKVENLGGKCV